MKKTGLFKIIMFILLGMVVATWIFSASYFSEGNLAELGMYNIGIFDFFSLIFGSFEFAYFLQIFFLLISIGALYGVLGKTGKYRAWVEKIANGFKGVELIFLLIVTFVIAVLTSVFDYSYLLLIFFPLLISIILAMGYDKVTALVATIGAMLVGTIGSTMGNSTSAMIAGLLNIGTTSGFYYKLALLIFGLVPLVLFLSKAKKSKTDIKKNEEDDLFIGEKTANKYSIVSLLVVFGVIFVLLIVACTAWSDSFKIDMFSNLHTKVTEFSPKLPYIHITSEKIETGTEKVAIFGKIFGTVSAFGEWRFAEMSIVCLVAAIVLGLLYRVKGIFLAMAEGAKKMLKPAFFVMLTYVVVYFAGNEMFFPTIAKHILSISNKSSVILSTIVMALGSALHVDVLYAANYVVPQLAAVEGANPTLLAVLAQSVYGVTMFIVPTSSLLVFGLSYLNVPYKEWVKKTWKLIVALLVVVLAVLLIAKFI